MAGYVNEAIDQNSGNETALIAQNDDAVGIESLAAPQGRRRGRPRRKVDPYRNDPSVAEALAFIAEVFVGDMLRLEREHGLNASEMLAYYKGELDLKILDEADDGACRDIHQG